MVGVVVLVRVFVVVGVGVVVGVVVLLGVVVVVVVVVVVGVIAVVEVVGRGSGSCHDSCPEGEPQASSSPQVFAARRAGRERSDRKAGEPRFKV